MKPGIHFDVSLDDYLALPYFSKSAVGPILKSPKHYKYELEHPKKSEAMDFGSAVDCMLLEPLCFAERFFVLPETYINSKKQEMPFTMQSKTCRAIAEEAAEKGQIPINAETIERAKEVACAVKSHPTAGKWLDGKKQATLIWIDPGTGITCKGRIDIMCPDRLVDLKVTNDPSSNQFSRVATTFKYHVQAAMYLMGMECAKTGKYPVEWKFPFSFIAVESEAPFDVCAYDIQTESLDAGREVFKSAIEVYADCVKTKSWPGISNFAEPLEIQQWAIHKILYEGVNNV